MVRSLQLSEASSIKHEAPALFGPECSHEQHAIKNCCYYYGVEQTQDYLRPSWASSAGLRFMAKARHAEPPNPSRQTWIIPVNVAQCLASSTIPKKILWSPSMGPPIRNPYKPAMTPLQTTPIVQSSLKKLRAQA